MFTGIVESVGTVVQVTRRAGSTRLAISCPISFREMSEGSSIAVDGVCLTVASRGARRFFADVIPETLGRTTLGELRPGDRVNLERPLRLGGPVGGHLVQGHVDLASTVLRVLKKGEDHRVRLALAPHLRRYVSEKGSITIQGVSLTVSRIEKTELEVALVPTTRRATTLGKVRVGDRLNVEVDLLARYLESLMKEPR